MTTHAAIADGSERHAGRVSVGFRADLTATFAVDPVLAPGAEVADAPVLATVSGGLLTCRLG